MQHERKYVLPLLLYANWDLQLMMKASKE